VDAMRPRLACWRLQLTHAACLGLSLGPMQSCLPAAMGEGATLDILQET
jgi:hypothetical protein